jgi:hypothetical protein
LDTIRAAKTRICTGKSLPVSNHPQKGNRLLTATIDEGSNNWAGYIAINGGYQEAFGFWNVPCLTLLLKTGYSNAWIGLGGDGLDGGGNLLQAGSESDEYQDGFGRFVTQYYAWYEDLPSQRTEQFAFSVNCGDQMYSDIYQYSSPIHMVIEDTTTGAYADKTNTNFSNGSTAEWIVERPTVSGAFPGLADFNYVAFQGCKAAKNSAYVSLIDLPHNYSNMYSNNNTTVLASPGALSVGSNGTNFNVNWRNYGP